MTSAFLDANVLFSTAYSDQSTLQRLWTLRGVRLCTSAYAVEEARRNLRDEAAQVRLSDLVGQLTLAPEADKRLIPPSVTLRDKDVPILASAIAARVDYLVTGDSRDFGAFFGKAVAGVLVLRPREFLALLDKTTR